MKCLFLHVSAQGQSSSITTNAQAGFQDHYILNHIEKVSNKRKS
jgi:hypothetical protein